MDKLAIVVPCYNEEEMLPISSEALRGALDDLVKKNKISEESFVLFVDDGSKDKTWELIEEEHKKYSNVYGLKLAGNVGHQFALTAGLLTAMQCSDVTISIDADLQDDIGVFEEMLDKYYGGCDIVYGVRNKRKSDTFFKRTTAQAFYKLMNSMGVKTVYNHADFRLMSQRAVKHFSEFKESNLFLRGMVPLIGYKTDNVYYERKERVAGESKYPLKKMLALAIEGKQRTSEAFAKEIEQLGVQGKSTIVFVIGGSLGLSDAVMKRSNTPISFGKMTLPHQLMRLVLIEQIYRGFKIVRNEPYHK